MDSWWVTLAFMGFLVLWAAWIAWILVWPGRVVERWAADGKLELTRCERRWLREGPFAFTPGGGDSGYAVFRLTVRDHRGHEHVGRFKVGGMFLGLLSDEVEARWEDEEWKIG